MTSSRPFSLLGLPLLVASSLAASCGDDDAATPAPELEVLVTEAEASVFRDFVSFTGDARIAVRAVADPASEVATAAEGPIRVAVVADLDCTECYRLDGAPGGTVVHGDAPLGVQYGLAHVLEAMGWRFYHPWRAHLPDTVEAPALGEDAGRTFEPDMTKRGIQIHTIHPIEGYYDLWEPGEENLEGAKRIVDWLVKNRANYLQWVALDNIQQGELAVERWMPHTEAIVDYAHGRGLRTGLNIQLFGASNLQRAFDLIDAEGVDTRTVARERLSTILPEPGFDEINLTFGEFFAADPAAFVDNVNIVREVIGELDPDVVMSAGIHVGDYEETRVTYMGEDLLYYFLIKFADPSIIHYVHTVMFYNLFEDAGGAYLHDEFVEHREYLLDRLRAGEPVAYWPESAYWVAFDNSVPQYFPVYVRSRWLDVHRIAETAAAEGFAPLDQHILFSTGWEWGYWQNDYATLRLGYTRPDRWEALFEDMFAPYGPAGAEVAGAIVDLTRAQQAGLIEQRLTPYIAGRDAVIDVGENMGIVSQPDRPSFEEVAAMDATARAAFVTSVIEPLDTLADATEAALARLRAAGAPEDDPFIRELFDGFEVDVHRTRFAHAIWSAAVAKSAGEPAEPHIEAAVQAMEAGQVPVTRRHESLHDPDTESMLLRNRNSTLYHHGYLFYAVDLCYWRREIAEARTALLGETPRVPSCVL